MDLQQLTEMGLSEEQAKAVMGKLDGSYVTKSRFNEVLGGKKAAEDAIKERDTQLVSLQQSAAAAGGSSGELAKLQTQISDLQKQNEEKDKLHEQEQNKIRVGAAAERQILAAKVKNLTAVKPFLKLEDAEIQEDGTVKGLAEQLQSLTKNDETSFLFETKKADAKPNMAGFVPAQKRDGEPSSGAGTLREAIAYKMEEQRKE